MARTFNRDKFLEQESRRLIRILAKMFVDSYKSSILDTYSKLSDPAVKESVKEITKYLNRRTKVKTTTQLEDFIIELVNLTFELIDSCKSTKTTLIYGVVSSFAHCFHLVIIQVSLINFTLKAKNKEASKNMLTPLLKINKRLSGNLAINASKLFKAKTGKSILHLGRKQETILNELEKLYKTKKHCELTYVEKTLFEIEKYNHLNFMLLVEMSGPLHDLSPVTDTSSKMVQAIEECLLIDKDDFVGLFFKADGFYAPETKTEINFFRIEKILMKIIDRTSRKGIKSYAKHLLVNRHRLYKRELGEDERRSPKFAEHIRKLYSYTPREKEILKKSKAFLKLGSNAFKKNSDGTKIVEKPDRAKKSLAKEIQKYLERGE